MALIVLDGAHFQSLATRKGQLVDRLLENY